MIKFQVKNATPVTRNWIDKSTGERRSMRIQQLLAYLPDSQGKTEDYDKIEVILRDQQNPYEVGFYQLTPASIYLDRNSRLQIGLNNLQPMQNKLAAAA